MANDKRQEFLNAGILGDGAGVPQERGFRPISTDYIAAPEYDASFFEAFPTLWASAYAFRKALTPDRQSATGSLRRDEADELDPATEEWVTLFLLHYYGVVHLMEYTQGELETNYDKDLWFAVSGTYPQMRDEGFTSVKLLQTSDGVSVGAYYPETIFFPARGRERWSGNRVLEPYLKDGRFSWWQASRIHLRETSDDFHAHLRTVAEQVVPGKKLKEKLLAFCARQFGDSPTRALKLSFNPSTWDIPGNRKPEPQMLLDRYPLRVRNEYGGWNYYLVYGMPDMTAWMQAAASDGPAPHQYRQSGRKEISVPFANEQIACPLDERDELFHLKEFFLTDGSYWCKIPKTAGNYAARIRSLHKLEMRNPVIKAGDVAVCLAPIERRLLEHFPSLFDNLKNISATPGAQSAVIEWTLFLSVESASYEIKWTVKNLTYLADLSKTSLALWPPRPSPQWKLYAAFGRGNKETGGRWHLVDERGAKGAPTELGDEEYISLLQPLGASADANRPRALLLTDAQKTERERGILFLNEFTDQTIDPSIKTSLAVDFGTSNTCLAFKRDDGESQILRFGLKPEMIWGEEATLERVGSDKKSTLERVGFVPFAWGGQKGFFPTVLMSRRSEDNSLHALKAVNIQAEHLFKVDVPSLHAGIEEQFYTGAFNRFWSTHVNMKWDLDVPTPWRSLFLGLTLLYAHAELFFNGDQGAGINTYIFTFPLAFTESDQTGFHSEAREMIRKVRFFCYGEEASPEGKDDKFHYVRGVDESTAIARSAQATSSASAMEIFIDVGGGTSDIAIRHNNQFLVLDSIRVAGNTFFRIANKNFEQKLEGSSEFKKHLSRVLQGKNDTEMQRVPHLNLGTFYSFVINSLSEDEFRKREAKVLQDGMGSSSYQGYRARLFFRHILAYALLQACAAAVERKLLLEDGLNLILGGNGWGLMFFAEFERKGQRIAEESERILQLLKRHLSPTLNGEEQQRLDKIKRITVKLLNETNLSKAKIDVALGALNAEQSNTNGERTAPYSGITMTELKINSFAPSDVRWCERWGFDEFTRRFGAMDQVKSIKFERPSSLREPFDSVLSVFTSLGNTSRNDKDNMPPETWHDINGKLCDSIVRDKDNKLRTSPLNHFISAVLYPEDEQGDFLDILAEENGNFKSKN